MIEINLKHSYYEKNYGDRGGVDRWDFSHDINMIKYNGVNVKFVTYL